MIRFRSLKSSNKPRASAVALIAGALLGAQAHADDTNWQLHGAFTQGVTYTSDNNFYGPSDDEASLKFTEISLNASARLLPNLRAAGQVLYRQMGEQGESGDIDFAFLDYQFLTKTTAVAGVRVGRYKMPIGLYNDTRDVAFTRPSNFVPQSAYPDAYRDFELSSDGALLYTDIFTDGGQWTLEVNGGRSRVEKSSIETALNFLHGEVQGIHHRAIYGGRLMYQSSDGRWVAAFSRAEAKLRYEYALLPILTTDVDISIVYWLASLQCNIDQWTITAEYGHMDATFDSDYFVGRMHPLQYYLQVSRHLGSGWSVYSRYDNLYWDRHDRNGDNYAVLTGRGDYTNFAHDYGVGVRYDISSNAMVSTEYHYIDGAAWLSNIDNPTIPTRYWSMLSAAFSYRF
ncbi:MAG: hypothetical protein QM709_00650 [Spongiibacteraceae bacterium]